LESQESPEFVVAEAAAGDPRSDDLEQIHRAATAALDLLARLYPEHPDMPR
jgi:hypothetical protein